MIIKYDDYGNTIDKSDRVFAMFIMRYYEEEMKEPKSLYSKFNLEYTIEPRISMPTNDNADGFRKEMNDNYDL